MVFSAVPQQRVTAADFQLLKVIGKGSFGKVCFVVFFFLGFIFEFYNCFPFLKIKLKTNLLFNPPIQVMQVRKKDTGRIYAMKVKTLSEKIF